MRVPRLFLFLSGAMLCFRLAAAQAPTQDPGSAVSAPTPPTANAASSSHTKNGSVTSPAGFSTPITAAKPADTKTVVSNEDENSPITTFVKRVDEVNVVFTVVDKHGRFIKDLTKSDFRILDNRQPPMSVVDFHSETDLPLRVGLLIDASNSVRDRFRFEQEAANYFLSQIVRPKSDRAFVLGFDTTPEITQDFTDDTEKLGRGIRMLRPGGGTAMFDALYYACRDKLMRTKESGPVRRAIILLSDGDDNQSRVTMQETIEMAQRAEVIIYAISTNVSNIKMPGDKIMEKISEATGGRAFFPFKIEDVSNAFAEVQDELRSQYALAYKPANFEANGKFRSIEIAAENKKYRVRARRGYYAPKQ